jgi:hypothetical protein
MKRYIAMSLPKPKYSPGGVAIIGEEVAQVLGAGVTFKLPNLTLNEIHNPAIGANTPTTENES